MKYVMMAVVFLLAACDKERVCKCRTTGGAQGAADTTYYAFNGSLSSAENSCVKMEKKKRAEGENSSAVCEITKEGK